MTTIDDVAAPTTPEITPMRVAPADVDSVIRRLGEEVTAEYNNRPTKRPRFLQTVG
jgi:hypothetical protein